MEHANAKQTTTLARRDKADVLRAILKRELDGLPLNHATVLSDDRQLHADILRTFQGWDDAMRAAGIDPRRIRRHQKWSRRAVVNRINQLADRGAPLNLRAIQTSEAVLASAADRYFGSWDEALAAAGIEPDRCRKRDRNWTRKRVVATIREIHANGGKLNHAALRTSSLSHAAVKLFGCWDSALRSAGLDPDEIRVYRPPWTRETLIEELQRKHRDGEPLNAKDVSPNHIRRPATRIFGCWDAALSAAGLDPQEIRGNRPRSKRANALAFSTS